MSKQTKKQKEAAAALAAMPAAAAVVAFGRRAPVVKAEAAAAIFRRLPIAERLVKVADMPGDIWALYPANAESKAQVAGDPDNGGAPFLCLIRNADGTPTGRAIGLYTYRQPEMDADGKPTGAFVPVLLDQNPEDIIAQEAAREIAAARLPLSLQKRNAGQRGA